MVARGEHLYVADGDRILVLSADDEPRELAEWTQRHLGIEAPVWRRMVRASRRLRPTAGGLVLYQGRDLLVLDLNSPTDASVRHVLSLDDVGAGQREKVGAALLEGRFLYVSTAVALYCFEMGDAAGSSTPCRLAGRRRATPVERLASRWPVDLAMHRGLLVEAGSRFGLLVYDVSDPARPKRRYHGHTETSVTAVGVWDGLLYAEEQGHTLLFYDYPGRRNAEARLPVFTHVGGGE